MSKRKPFDLSSPETQALRDEIVHGTLVTEGTLVAFPLCFPGDSTAVPADESHVTALDVAANWMVYGGTSGRRSHLVVGMFHGATGAVLDMGAVADATECVAVCCGTKRFIAFLNGPDGGQAVARGLQGLPFDLSQEWGFARPPLERLGPVVQGERVVHALADASRARAVGITEGHLFAAAIDEGALEILAELPGRGRVARGPANSFVGLDDGGTLWRWAADSRTLERRAIRLPDGSWDAARLRWASDPASGRLYVADDEGRLFAFDGEGFAPLGRTRFAPVGAMAATLDGRVFGACGDGIARLFCLHPGRPEVADLGCAVSVIERRRYGYQFADAAAGRDGQLYLAEDDDLGHLWIYFPKIMPKH